MKKIQGKVTKEEIKVFTTVCKRYVCSALDDLKSIYGSLPKTQRSADIFDSLIEEARLGAQRMEEALGSRWNETGYGDLVEEEGDLKKEVKKLKRQVEVLKMKKSNLKGKK